MFPGRSGAGVLSGLCHAASLDVFIMCERSGERAKASALQSDPISRAHQLRGRRNDDSVVASNAELADRERQCESQKMTVMQAYLALVTFFPILLYFPRTKSYLHGSIH